VKVDIVNINKFFNEAQISTIKSFISFLQGKIKLTSNAKIIFTDTRIGDMTTGVRKGNNKIYVFCKDRLLIDILRTLSHEWVHEYQYQTKFTKKVKHQDIGGPIENSANVLSGIFMKLFQEEYPQYEKTLYNVK
jgi:hypothetical protein